MAHRVAKEVDVELDDIWLYIARQSGSIDIADKNRRLDYRLFRRARAQSHMGRRRDEDLASGLRSFPVGNYAIIYCIENENAAILHVEKHEARQLMGIGGGRPGG